MTLRNTFVGADAHIGPLGSNEFAEDFHKDSAICGRTETSAPTGITKVFVGAGDSAGPINVTNSPKISEKVVHSAWADAMHAG